MRNTLFSCLTIIAGLWTSAAAAELSLEGKIEQGALIFGQTEAGATVTLDGDPLPVSDDGRFVFGFDRDAEDAVTLKVTLPGSEEIVRTLTPEKRDYVIQRIDGLPQKYVTPRDPETIERIKREVAMKAAARPVDTPGAWYTEDFVWPATGRISGVFGSQRILNGEPKRPHYGLDVAAPTGTPVAAPASGIVRLAEKDMYFEGGLIFLDHGHGVISAFMHLSDVFVKAGEQVSKGQKIAAVGSTGRSTGPHLHWHIYWRKAHVDPAQLVGPMPEDEKKAGAAAE